MVDLSESQCKTKKTSPPEKPRSRTRVKTPRYSDRSPAVQFPERERGAEILAYTGPGRLQPVTSDLSLTYQHPVRLTF